MSGVRGILAGSLTLITMHTLVAYKGPSDRIKQLSGIAVGTVNAFLSPDVPGIPQRTEERSPSTANPSGLPGLGWLPLPLPPPTSAPASGPGPDFAGVRDR